MIINTQKKTLNANQLLIRISAAMLTGILSVGALLIFSGGEPANPSEDIASE